MGSVPRTILQTQFQDRIAQFSPDRHRLAYVSDESGRFEAYDANKGALPESCVPSRASGYSSMGFQRLNSRRPQPGYFLFLEAWSPVGLELFGDYDVKGRFLRTKRESSDTSKRA
jgi:hypothetical protein